MQDFCEDKSLTSCSIILGVMENQGEPNPVPQEGRTVNETRIPEIPTLTVELSNTQPPPCMEETSENPTDEKRAAYKGYGESPTFLDKRTNAATPVSVQDLTSEEADKPFIASSKEGRLEQSGNIALADKKCHPTERRLEKQREDRRNQVENDNKFSTFKQAPNVSSKSFHDEANSVQSNAHVGALMGEKGAVSKRIGINKYRYKMSGSPCGLCVIIDNARISVYSGLELVKYKNCQKQNPIECLLKCPPKPLPDREGSNIDADSLAKTFKCFDFDVCIFKDLFSFEIFQTLREIGEGTVKQGMHSQLSKYQSFFLFILSHGENGYIYGVDGFKVPITEIAKIFTADNCPSLANKPKALHFQTCRGTKIMPVHAPSSDTKLHHDGPTKTMPSATKEDHESLAFQGSVPIKSDFLVTYSTLAGYSSFRSTTNGTFYISDLVKVLKKYHEYEDYESMLKEVN